MRGTLREIATTIIVAVVIFIVLQATVQSFIVIGSSMKPNFEPGQRLLVSKITYRFGEPQRGEVIVFRPPNNRNADYIKRIIALPGDTVEVKNETVYVNGIALYEPYLNKPPHYNLNEVKVSDNNYFVLGDNRNNSNDSHNGWTVKGEDIVGKAWLSIWPPDMWGLVAHYPPQEQLSPAEPTPQLTHAETNYGRSAVRAGVGN